MTSGVAIPLALTQGDPAGIGPDIALSAWANRNVHALPPFLYIGDPDVLEARARKLGIPVAIAETDPGDCADIFPDRLPLMAVPAGATVEPGRPDSKTASGTI